jgi:acetyl esterase/lipase
MYETVNTTQYAAKHGGSISVTDRSDRSHLMRVLQTIIRLFRSRINSGHPDHEDGSPVLHPPKSKLRNCSIVARTVCDIHVYDIIPPQKLSTDGKKRIYYFAGGSWQMVPSEQHWSLCAKLAIDMSDTIVSVVSMPIAPNDPAPSSFPQCLKLYRALLAEADKEGDRVILAGDSSGANIVLCLTLEALREDAESGTKAPYPAALMVISPSTDLTRDNPDIEKLRAYDPLLTPEIIKQTARAWTADWDPADRKVSPINGDISLLAKNGVKVHGVTAGCDVLAPDGVVFRNRLSKYEVQGEWLHWEKQIHCFVLTLPYGLREAKEGVDWIIGVLRKV